MALLFAVEIDADEIGGEATILDSDYVVVTDRNVVDGRCRRSGPATVFTGSDSVTVRPDRTTAAAAATWAGVSRLRVPRVSSGPAAPVLDLFEQGIEVGDGHPSRLGGFVARSCPFQKNVRTAPITLYSSSTSGIARQRSKDAHGCEMPHSTTSPTTRSNSPGTRTKAC